MVISKKIVRNKKLVTEQPKSKEVRVTLKQRMLKWISEQEGNDTCKSVFEAFPETVRRNVEKNMKDFHNNGEVSRNRCDCGCGYVYKSI